MEISRKLAIVSMCVLLVAATLVPALFLDFPSEDRVIPLSLNYTHHISAYFSGSGWNSNDELLKLIFSVSMNNMTAVLGAERVNGYPIWANVSCWYIGGQVSIGGHIISITSETDLYDCDCWRGEEEDTSVFYSKDLGLFIRSHYAHFESAGHLEMWGEEEEYTLTYDNLGAFDAIQIKLDGLLIAGILVEVAVLIGIVQMKHKTKE